MAKRKRSGSIPDIRVASKRSKIDDVLFAGSTLDRSHALHPLLDKCYRQVKTLKEYLRDALPTTSRVRRRRLSSFADENEEHRELLNSTLVGLLDAPTINILDERTQQWAQFSQTCLTTQAPSATTQQRTLDEVIDFVIWSLFRCRGADQKKSNHILCQGLDVSVTCIQENTCRPVLPGILQRQANVNKNSLRTPLWRRLMSVMGADGEAIFSNLLLDCGLFVRLVGGRNNYYQLSGIPLHDLCLKRDPPLHLATERVGRIPLSAEALQQGRKPTEITIVRHRILYSKPSLNRNKSIQFGLKHMHILNRLSDLQNREQDLTILRYIFPRQFKMHNVFTSVPDRRETVQPFKDYTFREDELRGLDGKEKRHLPLRLRGPALQLVRKLRRAHGRCSYGQLLAHYCQVPSGQGPHLVRKLGASSPSSYCNAAGSAGIQTQIKPSQGIHPSIADTPSTDENESSFLPYVNSAEQVSSFCRAALAKLLPRNTLGCGSDGSQNWDKMMARVDRFVRMRKFETINLHELVQCLKLKCMIWLAPNHLTAAKKLAATDKKKREELLHELVYYIFDSLLVPLINSNFYVTESGIHRNKLLYFRHDVWDRLCRPCLASAKLGTLVPVSASQLRGNMSNRLGFSLVRLLPKETGTRSITNLKRRTLKVINGKRFLSQSINAKLTPVFNIFNYERRRDTGLFKSDTLSLQHLHTKICSFKSQIEAAGKQRFYLVKTDIQSAFDSIPQAKMLDLVSQIFKHKMYSTVKHAECKYVGASASTMKSRNAVKFIKTAMPVGSALEPDALNNLSHASMRNTVYSDTGQVHIVSREQAKRLLEEHVQANIVKVGKKCYRQSVGIPQGSILSSLLCTFFYNDFEATRLSFLDPDSSLLLRIVDDFLLITTNQSEAVEFVKAMKSGDASYGIFIHPEKSLVNFDMTIDGVQIPRLSHTSSFPFCGLSIDSRSLHVSKDRVRKDNVVANTLTVDVHGHAGEKFKRRILSSLRIQLQSILLDMSINSRTLVMRTLIESFQESAMKMHQYYTSMPRAKQPSATVVINLIEQLISLVTRTMQQRRQDGEQNLTRQQICSLAASGVARVLSSRNTRYSTVLKWLRELKLQTQHSLNMEPKALEHLVEISLGSLQHYIY